MNQNLLQRGGESLFDTQQGFRVRRLIEREGKRAEVGWPLPDGDHLPRPIQSGETY
jgi:hypothetical protein